MGFKIINTNKFTLPNTRGRFTHIATIHGGLREFIYFVDKITYKTYIEEITGGTLKAVDDDNLWNDLAMTLKQHGLDVMARKE